MTRSALMRMLGGATLGAALMAAPAALAHDHDAKHEKKTEEGGAQRANLQGTVEAIGNGDLTLRERSGRMLKVELDEDTTFDNAGKTGAVSDLRTGMIVTIRGEKQRDGTVQADSIRYAGERG